VTQLPNPTHSYPHSTPSPPPNDTRSPNALQRNTNHIIAQIRPGGRLKAALDELTQELTTAWDEVVNPHSHPSTTPPTSKSEGIDTELRTVFVLGSISAGREAGFALPEVSLDPLSLL